jgi:hypothetical protein
MYIFKTLNKGRNRRCVKIRRKMQKRNLRTERTKKEKYIYLQYNGIKEKISEEIYNKENIVSVVVFLSFQNGTGILFENTVKFRKVSIFWHMMISSSIFTIIFI